MGLGRLSSYQISASDHPTAYSATGLPAGISCNTATGLISGSPNQSGTFNVTLRASNFVGTGTASVTIIVQTVYSNWKASVFGAAASNPLVAGDLVVNNPAGIPNLMAYALGANPFSAAVGVLPKIGQAAVSGTSYLSLQFQRNADDATLRYTVEASDDLTNANGWAPLCTFNGAAWNGSGSVNESGTAPNINVQVLDSQPIGAKSMRFMRLQISY
jgi:hypothetical protein